MRNDADRSIKQKTVTGIFWKLMENGGNQLISLVITVILARLIDPSLYGTLSLTVIFTSIANVLVQRGFNLSLVQKRDADELDFSSVFWFSFAVAGGLYAALFLAAPAIAAFYRTPEVKTILRVIALILFTGAVGSIQYAIVMREMAFRARFIVSFVSTVLSGAVGIGMAVLGFGVWALVAQQLIDGLVMAVGLTVVTKWLPKRRFSFARLRTLFSFGWKLLVSSLLETVYSEITGLIIGRRYNTEMLAYYDKGRRFPNIVGTNLSGAIQAAMFPAFTTAQDDRERLLTMVRRSVATSAFVVFPMLAGMAALATPIVSVLLTDKWLPAAPFLMIFALTFAMYPIDATVLQAINALGRSDVYLKLEIAKKVAGIALLAVGVFLFDTAAALAWALAGTAVLSVLFNAIPAKRLIGYRYGMLAADTLPTLLLSLAMGGAVYLLTRTGLEPLVLLIAGVPLGAAVYVLGAWGLRLESFRFCVRSVKEILTRRGARGGA